jgi:hypothetical protein
MVPATTVDEGVAQIVDGLCAMGYRVVIWREDVDDGDKEKLIEEHGKVMLDLFTSDQLFDRLTERDDWKLVDALENLSDDEVIEECVRRQIELAEADKLLPIARAAVRVAYASMTTLYDELHQLKMELKDKGIGSAQVGELILR